MHELEKRRYAVVLAFDVPVDRDAQTMADDMGIRIFTANIIYHLFDAFTEYVAVRLSTARLEADIFTAESQGATPRGIQACGNFPLPIKHHARLRIQCS